MIQLILLVLIFSSIYLYITFKKYYGHWSKKGVKGPMPLPIVGTFANVIFIRQSIDTYAETMYHKFPEEKVVGLYAGTTPILLVRDVDYIKNMLVKDFAYFQDRGVKTAEGGLSNNLFGSEGEVWKVLRFKLSPLFTSKKLKEMLPTMKDCVNNYVNYVDYLIDNNVDHEIKSLMSKYTLSVMGSCMFGMNFKVYSEDIKVYTQIARYIFVPDLSVRVWYILNLIIPGINNKFSNIDPAAILRRFFLSITSTMMREREGISSPKKDLIDLLMSLKKNGRATRTSDNGISEIEIDDDTIAAQVFVFFGAGFETSSTTMCYLLYEMALNQNIQERVYQEICDIYERYNGDINYDAVEEMNYLKLVFDETLRKYTVLGTISRKSVMDYTIPGTNITIEKGTRIFVSSYGLHKDTKYFKYPEEFNPDNFLPENKTFPDCAYMPFGLGPRRCVGLRFARLQSVLATAAFLRKFKVEPNHKTRKNIKDDPKTLTFSAPGGIWLKISRRK